MWSLAGRIALSVVRARVPALRTPSVVIDDIGTVVRADVAGPFGQALYRYGLQAPEARLIAALLRPGDVFLDGGAHVGVFSLIAAAVVGRTGRVIACEPVPETMRLLEENVALNGYGWVDTWNVALADGSGQRELYSFGPASGLSSFAPATTVGSHRVMVDVTTLDDIVKGCDPTRVRLVKLDLEGAEVRALRGATTLLQSRPDFLVEIEPAHLARQGTNVEELRAMFAGSDYHGYEIHGDLANPSLVPVDVWDPPAANPNMLISTRPYPTLVALLDGTYAVER